MYGAEVPDLCVLLASVFPWNGGQWWCSSCLKLGLAENVYLAGFAVWAMLMLLIGRTEPTSHATGWIPAKATVLVAVLAEGSCPQCRSQF